MKLWYLRAREDLPQGDNPWHPWYDKSFGFVACAENEEEARQLASAEARNEHGDHKTNPWLKAEYTTCEELTPDRGKGIVICDHRSA